MTARILDDDDALNDCIEEFEGANILVYLER